MIRDDIVDVLDVNQISGQVVEILDESTVAAWAELELAFRVSRRKAVGV